jgi:hypothetical protein
LRAGGWFRPCGAKFATSEASRHEHSSSGLAGRAAGTLATPAIVAAQGTRVKMGALRLIHSITPFFYERFMPAGCRWR